MSLETISRVLNKIGNNKVQCLIFLVANIYSLFFCFSYFQHHQITKMALDEIRKDPNIGTIEKVELISEIRDEAYDEYYILMVSLFTFWFGYSLAARNITE